MHQIEGVPTLFSVAKTVADRFKYRNKIGLDVALEALREALKQRKATTALWEAAKVCRVSECYQTLHGGARLKPVSPRNLAA